MSIDLSHGRVVVTGAHGFLGQAVCATLREVEVGSMVTPSHTECDLLDPRACESLLMPDDVVIHLAAKVGGIGFNKDNPGALFYENLMMGVQLMEAARRVGVRQFLTVGTICAYPKFTPVPFHEEALWDGYPEETNAPYGVAKKALLVMGQAYHDQYDFPARYVLPVNLYGPNDNFDPNSSHVIPALIKKVYDAQQLNLAYITCWGDGSPTREFLYVDDAARGVVAATQKLTTSAPVNLGTNQEISIYELIQIIVEEMGYTGEVRWDRDKPNGQPRRCLDIERARALISWRARVSFKEGLRETIEWYRRNPLPVSADASW